MALLREEGLEELAQAPPPAAWRAAIVQATPARCAVTDNSTVIDRETASSECWPGLLVWLCFVWLFLLNCFY